MRRIFFAALAICLLLVPALQSAAQYGDDPPDRLAFKIGLYTPTGTKFQDNIKSMWRCLGAEYALEFDDLDRPTTVASGFITSSDSSLVEAKMVGLQYEKRWYANKTEKNSLYYSGGLGYYILDSKDRDFTWMNWTDRSGGKLGATAAAGYQFKESFFGEIRYSYSGELGNGLDFSGLSINGGIRLSF